MDNVQRLSIGCFLLILLLGCISQGVHQEQSFVSVEDLEAAAWTNRVIKLHRFDLQAFVPTAKITKNSELLAIYIEGDGNAWLNSDTPAIDPTPQKSLPLTMAIQSSAMQRSNSAYLARPCQYIGATTNPQCKNFYWTDGRYSAEVIDRMNEGISALKKQFAAKNVVLIGYSGGGVIALLCAARRSDVLEVVTIASNLDTEEWIRSQKLSPLNGSLNPVDFAAQLANIRQVHYAGGRDTVVPIEAMQSYINRFPMYGRPKVVELPEYGHVCCWMDGWKSLNPMQKYEAKSPIYDDVQTH